jgi:Tfp pilus assembly protein PilV
VELVVAIVVLTIGLLASASVIGNVTVRQMRSTSRIEMMTVADSKLEHLRIIAANRAADTVQLTVGGSITTPTGVYSDVVTTPGGKEYRTQWAVTAGVVGTRVVQLRVVPVTPTRGDLKSLDFTATFLLL